MAKAIYWQRGESLDFINKTENAIEANSVVVIGKRIGVAGTDIAPGDLGSLHVTGVFEIPKKPGTALSMGDAVGYTEEEGIDAAAADAVGYAAADAAADAATALIKLLG